MVDPDVLIAGAGPIGLTAAIELARRGDREIQQALIKVALPHLAIRLDDVGGWERSCRSANSTGSPSLASSWRSRVRCSSMSRPRHWTRASS